MREAAKLLEETLITEGIKAILAQGVEGFSIRAVAETCHVSCATPFKHFKGKENYFARMSERLDDELTAIMEQIELRERDNPKQAHLDMCQAYIRHLIQYPFLINTSFWRIINEEKKIGIRDWKSFQMMIEQFRRYSEIRCFTKEQSEELYFAFQTFAYGTAFVMVSDLKMGEFDLEEMVGKIQNKICLDAEGR